MSPAPQQNRGSYSGGGNRPNNPQSLSIDVSDIKFGADISPELFANIAQKKAKAIAEEGGGRKNKSSQLRKFYDELNMWHDKVFRQEIDNKATAGQEANRQALREERYKELAPFIKMLCAKVTYAKGREHVSVDFEKLFTHVIRAINSPDTLKQAKLFIEAFMGFYKAEEKK